MKFLIKALIKIFRSPNAAQVSLLTPREQFIGAQSIIRAFYAILFFFSIENLPSWEKYLNRTNPDLLWPVFWLQHVNIQHGITAILWFQLLGGILAVTFSHLRMVRIAVFISLLEFLAFKNSFGKIGHGSHLSLLLSFVLIFLPDGWHSGKSTSKSIRTATLIVFSGCQALIVLTYTMSGIGKVISIIIQAARGEVHALEPKALALQIAERLLETDTTSYFGPWLINHYYVGWLLMIGTLYLQLFSFWVAFRPSLHQIWAFGLILFHLGVYFTMTITFEQNCLWLALFFLNSPFRLKIFEWQQIIQDFPLIGSFFPQSHMAVQPKFKKNLDTHQ